MLLRGLGLLVDACGTRVAVAVHCRLLLAIHGRVHQGLPFIINWMPILLLLLPVHRLVRVAPLVKTLPVLVALHRHQVIVLHVLRHSRGDSESVQVVGVDSILKGATILKRRLQRRLELLGLQKLLLAQLVATSAADGAHARLRALLGPLRLLVRIARMLLMMLRNLSIAVAAVSLS